MNAILGKITHIDERPLTTDHRPPSEGPPFPTVVGGRGAQRRSSVVGSAATTRQVRFKPACLMPERKPIPEWLKDQTLTVTREVADPRELGHPGDSIVLTPAESERWLYPLTATPNIAYGALPPTVQIRLRWWKEEKLPEFTVSANGHRVTGTFERETPDARRQTPAEKASSVSLAPGAWRLAPASEASIGVAFVETAPFFSYTPNLPVTLEVTCDKMRAACTVLPAQAPFHGKILPAEGERHRIESDWYAIDIGAQSHAGAIAALTEKGRGVDHFRRPAHLIHEPYYHGGHLDRIRQGWDWSEKMAEVAMATAGARRDAGATRLRLEGVVDEGANLRTSVVYTLMDALPLLRVERDYEFLKGKEKDEKEKDDKPKEPIDDLKTVGLGFRAAAIQERDGTSGSRILCTDGERLVTYRPGEELEEYESWYWRMKDGWAIMEHPRRRECIMYLFDGADAPYVESWSGLHWMTLQPLWPFLPMRVEQSVGYAIALVAGEACGAAAEGAWVACRVPWPDGGVRCAVIARMKAPLSNAAASIAVGSVSQEAPLQPSYLPGISEVGVAVVTLPLARMEDELAVTVAGIPKR
jgi:hypothetical protein